jgi:hypothetical protein
MACKYLAILLRNGDITTKMDAVTKVARDCLLACVECNILQVNIVVSRGGHCSGSSSGTVRVRVFLARLYPDPAKLHRFRIESAKKTEFHVSEVLDVL